jgi:hypothetical protein
MHRARSPTLGRCSRVGAARRVERPSSQLRPVVASRAHMGLAGRQCGVPAAAGAGDNGGGAAAPSAAQRAQLQQGQRAAATGLQFATEVEGRLDEGIARCVSGWGGLARPSAAARLLLELPLNEDH